MARDVILTCGRVSSNENVRRNERKRKCNTINHKSIVPSPPTDYFSLFTTLPHSPFVAAAAIISKSFKIPNSRASTNKKCFFSHPQVIILQFIQIEQNKKKQKEKEEAKGKPRKSRLIVKAFCRFLSASRTFYV